MPTLAMVYNTSRVFWGPVIRFRSSCKIDITFFPFDTQICRLKLGSWAYTGLEVNVWNSSNTMDLSNFVDNGEWELLGVAVERNIVYYNCCEEPFPDVTFSIQLRRRTKYYFMNIIIPCIILSFLCLGGFLLPPESGEKITLGLSVLLTITVFMLMVADKMPQTSESISVISIYLMVVLTTSCLSVLSSVLVLSIFHQRGGPTRAPWWLRKFCFHIVTPLLCLHQRHDVTTAQDMISRRHDVTSAQDMTSCRHRRGPKGSKIASSEDEHFCLKMDYTDESDDCVVSNDERNQMKKGSTTYEQVYMPGQRQPKVHKTSYTPMQQQTAYTLKQCNDSPKLQRKLIIEDTEPPIKDSDINQSADVEGDDGDANKLPEDNVADDVATCCSNTGSRNYYMVARCLVSLIQTRQEIELKDEGVFKEWHDVAFVLDRLLFYIFFLITLVSTLCILEMRPTVQTI